MTKEAKSVLDGGKVKGKTKGKKKPTPPSALPPQIAQMLMGGGGNSVPSPAPQPQMPMMDPNQMMNQQ